MGIEREIDKLGRIVLPISYRQRLNLTEHSVVRVDLKNNAIVITPVIYSCVLCGSTTDLSKEKPLCINCIRSIKELH